MTFGRSARLERLRMPRPGGERNLHFQCLGFCQLAKSSSLNTHSYPGALPPLSLTPGLAILAQNRALLLGPRFNGKAYRYCDLLHPISSPLTPLRETGEACSSMQKHLMMLVLLQLRQTSPTGSLACDTETRIANRRFFNLTATCSAEARVQTGLYWI